MKQNSLLRFLLFAFAALLAVSAFPSLFMPMYPDSVGRTVAQLGIALLFAVFCVDASVRKGWGERVVMVGSALFVAFGSYCLRYDPFDVAYAFVWLAVCAGAMFLRSRKFRPEQAGRNEWLILSAVIAGACWAANAVSLEFGNNVYTTNIHGASRIPLFGSFGREWSTHLFWLVMWMAAGVFVVAWAGGCSRGLDAFLSHRTIDLSPRWRRIFSSWLTALGFFLIVWIALLIHRTAAPYSLTVSHASALSNGSGFGAVLFTIILPFIIGYRTAATQVSRKLLYSGAVFLLIMLVCMPYFGSSEMRADVSTWYQLLTMVRGKHVPRSQKVVSLMFPVKPPSMEELTRIIRILDKSEPSAFVFPRPYELSATPGYSAIDSALKSTIRHAKLIIGERGVSQLLVNGDMTRDTAWVTRNLNTVLHRRGPRDEKFGYAYIPLYKNLLDLGIAAAHAYRSVNRRGALPLALAEVLGAHPLDRPRLVDPYSPLMHFVAHIYPNYPGQQVSRTFNLSTFSAMWVLHLFDNNVERGYEPGDGTREDHIPALKDKVIFVVFDADFGRLQTSESVTYAMITQNIIDGEFIERAGSLWIVLSTILVMTSLIAMYVAMRPWKALLLSGVAAIAAVAFLAVLFAEFHTFMHPYPFLFSFVGSVLFLLPFSLSSERRAILEDRTRLTQELRSARDMQMGLMPKSDPVVDGYEFAGVCRPASEVGGDFYDYVWLDKKKTKLGIAVADVSGKAMKAAMTAVMTSGMLYSETRKSDSPREILRGINHPLYLRSDRRTFTAMGFSVLDTRKRTLTFASAGQAPPIRIRNARADELPVKGVRLPLGVQEELLYMEGRATLRKGDVIALYTDGIVEAMNEKREMYGFERLMKDLERWHDFPATAIRDRLMGEIKTFVGNAPQHDDMTVVVVKVLP